MKIGSIILIAVLLAAAVTLIRALIVHDDLGIVEYVGGVVLVFLLLAAAVYRSRVALQSR
jgi:hypothetical protein